MFAKWRLAWLLHVIREPKSSTKRRLAAIKSLARIRHPAAAMPLCECLLAGGWFGSKLRSCKTIVEEALQAFDRIGANHAVVQFALSRLHAPTDTEEEIILEIAGRWGGQDAVQPIIDYVTNSSRCSSWRVVAALQKIGQPCIPILRSSLETQNRRLQLCIVATLGGLRDKESAPKLIQLLRDPPEGDKEGEVKEGVIRALGKIGTKDCIVVLLDCVKLAIEKWDQRDGNVNRIKLLEVALEVLGDTRDKEVVPRLASLMQNFLPMHTRYWLWYGQTVEVFGKLGVTIPVILETCPECRGSKGHFYEGEPNTTYSDGSPGGWVKCSMCDGAGRVPSMEAVHSALQTAALNLNVGAKEAFHSAAEMCSFEI